MITDIFGWIGVAAMLAMIFVMACSWLDQRLP